VIAIVPNWDARLLVEELAAQRYLAAPERSKRQAIPLGFNRCAIETRNLH